MSRNLQTGVLALASVLALALARAIPALFAEGMPQVAGEDVLAVVLGDARQELSGVLLDKVEEYYHGGVRHTDCESGLTSAGAGHDEHAASEPREPSPFPAGASDPWQWINRQVHTQEDRHLEQERAVELLPWLWASSRASPKNVQAFQIGAYVLASMNQRPDEAARLLEDGIGKNPACAELEFSLGELLLSKLRDAARAETHFQAALEKCRPAEGAEGDAARGLKVQTLFYLGYLARQRGERERVEAYLKAAEAVAPEHVCTQNLRALLKKIE